MSLTRALVTGATGGLGRTAVEMLLARGIDVVATGRNEDIGRALAARGARFVAADLVNSDVGSLVSGCDVVFHCAALSAPWGARADFVAANVVATERLARAAHREGRAKFVHISTPSIYFDFRDRLNIREDDPLPTPANAYAETKALAEARLRVWADNGLPVVMLRPRALFGPYDTVLVPRMLRALRNGVLPVVNHGRAVVDVTYLENVAHAMWLAATRDTPQASAYNITNGEPMPLADLIKRLFDALGVSFRTRNLPRGAALCLGGAMEGASRVTRKEPLLTRYSAGVLGYSQTLSLERAAKDLGYRPLFTVEQGIERYAQWVARHG
ncbi:NAD-dependent epimerase/dehydratase family protein [Paraburkholderia sp. UCT31]|uniref:NAD-dependent epimerase/dehydratase family protein n=1 Tax=Paraburkholderia sp. UCT31 TaxID=2615209 RepID=UPI001655236F|nr:NAD-dependent epimerase/dehydratase family protein [Paraburkholderia sp. UCT31]MBC8742013.1 NAD-dependent epimerase/dehydratase family protein [Paraburkholderia sp. UCT31]